MGLMDRLKGRKPEKEPSLYWRCPKCGATLEKGAAKLGFNPYAVMIGTATCGHCGAQFQQSDVYGGKYDI